MAGDVEGVEFQYSTRCHIKHGTSEGELNVDSECGECEVTSRDTDVTALCVKPRSDNQLC